MGLRGATPVLQASSGLSPEDGILEQVAGRGPALGIQGQQGCED